MGFLVPFMHLTASGTVVIYVLKVCIRVKNFPTPEFAT
jgi:hypothetical protein